jgi:hypothetical protein
VLGREFDLSAVFIDADALSSAVGNSVYVEGQWEGETLVATTVTVYDEYAVPGATTVFLAGSVDDVDRRTGRLVVAGLEIDVTSVDITSLEPADRLAISGIQPLPGGLIIADSVVYMDANLVQAADDVDQSDLSLATE